MESKERLISLRKSQKMSQAELAEKLGVSRQTVSRWERGTVTIGAENLAAISRLFGVSMESLINLGTPPAAQEAQPVQEEKTEQKGGMVKPEQEEPAAPMEKPTQREQTAPATEIPQEVPRKKRFVQWLAAAGALTVVFAAGLSVGILLMKNSARDAIPANVLPPDGTYTATVSTENGDYVIQYEKHKVIRQDEIESEEIDPAMIEDFEGGWYPIEDN